jgi:hypothetical protein
MGFSTQILDVSYSPPALWQGPLFKKDASVFSGSTGDSWFGNHSSQSIELVNHVKRFYTCWWEKPQSLWGLAALVQRWSEASLL